MVRKGRLVIRPVVEPRKGWEEAFRRMARKGDDRLLDREVGPLTRWDKREWKFHRHERRPAHLL